MPQAHQRPALYTASFFSNADPGSSPCPVHDVTLPSPLPWPPALQLAAGVDNLLDREYRDHLGGYNRAANPDIALRERLPGYGINAFARLVYEF